MIKLVNYKKIPKILKSHLKGLKDEILFCRWREPGDT